MPDIINQPDLAVLDVYVHTSHSNPLFGDPASGTIPHSLEWANNRVTGRASPKDWARAISAGQNATSLISGTKYTVGHSRGFAKQAIKNSLFLPPDDPGFDIKTWTYQGYPNQIALPSDSGLASLSLAEDQASAAFLKKASAAITSTGGVFVAELQQAVHGIRHPAEALVDFLKNHAKRTKRILREAKEGKKSDRSRREISKILSKLWLEAKFHWAPLVGDLESAATTLAKVGAGVETQYISAIGTSYGVQDTPVVTLNEFNVFFFQRGVRYKERRSVKFYGCVRCQNPATDGGFAPQALNNLGFNFRSFVPTIWELIPFSFVADYFSNLGDMITAYSFPISAVTWMNRTIRVDNEHIPLDPRWVEPAVPEIEYGFSSPGHFYSRLRTMQRSDFNPGNLVPSIRWEVPGWNSFNKWLNLSALANILL